MGRPKQMPRPEEPKPAARKVATVEGLNRERTRLYYVHGNAVFSAPRRGYPGSTRKEADLPGFEPRQGYMYYLKGSDVMEVPMQRR